MANNVFQGPFTITSAAIVGALGYTPLNKAGDTMTGDLLFTDASYDIGKSGATRPRHIYASGNATVGGALSVTGGATISGSIITNNSLLGNGDVSAGATGRLIFASRGTIKSPADGVMTMLNAAEANFTRLNLGGSTSSFPALGRLSNVLSAVLADGSAYTGFYARHYRCSAHTVATLPSAGSAGDGTLAWVTDANATTRLSVAAGGGSNKVLVYCDGTDWLIV